MKRRDGSGFSYRLTPSKRVTLRFCAATYNAMRVTQEQRNFLKLTISYILSCEDFRLKCLIPHPLWLDALRGRLLRDDVGTNRQWNEGQTGNFMVISSTRQYNHYRRTLRGSWSSCCSPWFPADTKIAALLAFRGNLTRPKLPNALSLLRRLIKTAIPLGQHRRAD